MSAIEEYPDGSSATVKAAHYSILHFSFGQVPPLADSVPEGLEGVVRDLLAYRQVLAGAVELYCGLKTEADRDLTIAARDKTIVASGKVWTWFRKHPTHRHKTHRIAGHVLFWGFDDRYFTLCDEQGRQPCTLCGGYGKWVIGGRAVTCQGCEGEGTRLVAEWVPALMAKVKGGDA